MLAPQTSVVCRLRLEATGSSFSSLPSHSAMPSTARGLYELLVTEALEARLSKLGERHIISRAALREAEAADRIAVHLGRIVQRAVASFGREERVERGIELARKLIDEILLVAEPAA